MNPRTDFNSHYKKDSIQDMEKNKTKTEIENKKIYNQNNNIKINSNRVKSPLVNEKQFKPLKMKSSQIEYNNKYTSNTHNPLHIINSRKNRQENSKNDNDNSSYISKMKKTLNNQYNYSANNILNIKNISNTSSRISYHNQQNNRRNNQLSLNINSENNKYFVNEELNNKKANNLLTKVTIISKVKNLGDNNRHSSANKRLNLKSVEPSKRNSNTIFYSENKTHKKDIQNGQRQNSFNNHKFYDSNSSRRNKDKDKVKKEENIPNTNSNNIKTKISNNINIKRVNMKSNRQSTQNTLNTQNINTDIQNKRIPTIKIIKNNTTEFKNKVEEKEKKKEISKDDHDIKMPRIKLSSAYNNTIKTPPNVKDNNDGDEEEEDEDINTQNHTMPSLMFNQGNDFGEQKTPIKLSPLIFGMYHPKFKNSIHSLDNEFKSNDELIKAYAYNTSEGNIREYNEDTITVTKINLNSHNKNDYCYFFAVYDGHGGNGCSMYLKNNLHKNIKEFSVNGIKSAIEITEDNFLRTKAVDQNLNLLDTSGSCGVILLIKNKKCIVANVGDSRLVIFKNKRVIFSTKDHKPNTYIEKRRIELAGGSVYQTTAVIPIYQNGKLIEIPWRVCPGGLSVSRTFGDIESKDELYGGKKNVVIVSPDINEFDLNEEYNFIVIGCDGIFDVLSNGEIIECIKIVLKLNKGKNRKINELCGDFANMIIKSAMAKESFDNVSCIVIVFNIKDFI